MMNHRILHVLFASLAISSLGCNYEDIPPGQKGRLFEKGGLSNGFDGKGWTGSILAPGTHPTGWNGDIRTIECVDATIKESMEALTKDGVQFKLDMYLNFSVNCDNEEAGKAVLSKLVPIKPEDPVTAKQIYDTYVRPELGEAVRVAISPRVANDINSQRDAIYGDIRKRFDTGITDMKPAVVVVRALNLSSMDFPESMDKANAERAVQAILKDRAIAERERVVAEIETAKMRNALALAEAGNEVSKISAIGAALKANPAYLQYDMQQRLTGIYETAGAKGNLVIAAPNPITMLPHGGVVPVPKQDDKTIGPPPPPAK